jgi:AcrR family transcriptional regulator
MAAGDDALPRGRHHLTREEVEASQRRRILLAMTEEVAVRGYAATSVAHITARAGVSRKSFYEQFTDKEDCYFAAFDAAGEILVGTALRSVTEMGLDAAADPIAAFAASLEAFCDAIVTFPAAARTLMVEVYAVGPSAMQRRAGTRNFLISTSMTPLGFVDEHGQPTFVAEALAAAISSLVTNRVAEDRIDEIPGLVEPIVAWVASQIDPTR